MLYALIEDSSLTSPTVGTWTAVVPSGAVLHAEQLLGYLLKNGRRVAVHCPAKAAGLTVHQVPSPRSWVAYGAPLCTVGAAQDQEGAVTGQAAAVGGGPEGATAVRAATDGTIYLRPEPSAPEFAPVGSTIETRGTLALVEVMKTFTPVRAPLTGTVVQVDVEDGEGVEEGQVLFWVAP